MSEHVDERVDCEQVNATAYEMADAWLCRAEQGRGIALGHAADQASQLSHQHGAHSKVLSLFIVESEFSEDFGVCRRNI
jgi:hypothetical protein